jgi:hypothetical protein
VFLAQFHDEGGLASRSRHLVLQPEPNELDTQLTEAIKLQQGFPISPFLLIDKYKSYTPSQDPALRVSYHRNIPISISVFYFIFIFERGIHQTTRRFRDKLEG